MNIHALVCSGPERARGSADFQSAVSQASSLQTARTRSGCAKRINSVRENVFALLDVRSLSVGLQAGSLRYSRLEVCATVLALLLCFANAFAAEVMPPKPDRYFNDYAHVVSDATAARLNQQLESFEKETSSQIVVAVYPKMQSDSSVEDYTVRVAQAWGVGQKDKKNGAVLFVFIQDRKMYIQVGYGLEGAIPDATAKRIVENEVKPGFRAGNYDAGLTAGVNALIAAAKGEYKGTGQTVYDQQNARGRSSGVPVVVLFVVVFGFFFLISLLRAAVGGRRRRRFGFYPGWTIGSGGWSSSSSSGSWGGGGGSSGGGWGGGGGFSGGGGSFGGGGAGGSW